MIEIVVFTLPFNGCSEHLPICVGSISRHVRGGLKTFFLFGFVGDSSQFKFIKSTGVCDPGLGVICLQTVNDGFYNTNHRFHLPLSRFTPTLGRWHKTLPYQGGGGWLKTCPPSSMLLILVNLVPLYLIGVFCHERLHLNDLSSQHLHRGGLGS